MSFRKLSGRKAVDAMGVNKTRYKYLLINIQPFIVYFFIITLRLL